MKIRINEFESYDIKIDEEVDAKKFLGIMDRLRVIEKLLSRDVFFKEEMQIESQPGKLMKQIYKKEKKTTNYLKVSDLSPEQKQRRYEFTTRLHNDRNLVIRLYKGYYESISEQNFQDIFRDLKLNEMGIIKYNLGSNGFKRFLKMHNIQPNEVGLSEWIQRGGTSKRFKINGTTTNTTANI